MSKIDLNRLTDYDFYDKREFFGLMPKNTVEYMEGIEVMEEMSEMEKILFNIETLKEGKWYRVQPERVELIKLMMDAKLLPDISFNDDFTMIRRYDTDLCIKIMLKNADKINDTKRVVAIGTDKKAV